MEILWVLSIIILVKLPIGRNQPTLSGVWPKGTNHTYVDGVAVIVQAEVTAPGGQKIHPLKQIIMNIQGILLVELLMAGGLYLVMLR
jgi:hypothetical protein